jgi:ATP-dependent DNA helicase RecQ
MVEESQADDAHKRIDRAKLDALLGWCEVTSCRRQQLLEYFGDKTQHACGNCDICLRPPVTWDATEAAQMALSCVYRTGQRFGAGHVIDVLRGQKNDKVLRFGHDQLSTFNIGAAFQERQWRSIFRQLVVRGFLNVDHASFGALRLSESSRSLLRGETRLLLREEQEKPRIRRTKVSYSLELEDEDLMEALREARREIATARGVPPYVIFHDSTLLEMIALRPAGTEDLLQVSGVGQAKLEAYGETFLEVIRRFHPPR